MNNDSDSKSKPSNHTAVNNVEHWQYPMPLKQSISTPDIPYPTDALPTLIQNTVCAYQQYGQQPYPLISASALANISLACQSLANVARDDYLISPVSLYFLTIAGSGERKSAVDNTFSKASRKWEESFRKSRESQIKTALTLHKTWQMERDGLLSQIKRAAFSGEDAELLKFQLEYLIDQEPEIPLLPTLYFEDTTQEALAAHLANGWPSASLWSDEAGIIIGNHSMQSNPTRFAALLNRLWEGKDFSAHRKSSQSFMIQNRRLTLNLMMQPLLLQKMSASHSGIHRQSGFMARCLMAKPASSMGKRLYQSPPDNLNFLLEYEKCLNDCLNQSRDLTHAGCYKLPVLQMSVDAKKHWVLFFNQMEAGLSDNGQWVMIKDFASKGAENAARLAALFHLFLGRCGDISAENMERAIAIINWHMQETRRLFDEDLSFGHLSDAQKLIDWLLKKNSNHISLRNIQRLSPIRDKEKRDDAIASLIEYHYVALKKIDGKSCLELNPYLL